RRMYEIMRYWDDDLPDWDAEDRDFAAVWRSPRKGIVSRSLKSGGPNVALLEGEVQATIPRPKAQLGWENAGARPHLAGSLTNLGLIDEYRLSLHPIVLGHGQPFFVGPRPPLHLVDTERIGEDVIRLTYVPA